MREGMSGRQVFSKLGITPRPDARGGVRCDVVGAPGADHCACKLVPIVERLAEIARRMTVAAMREGFRQVGPAIPFGATVRMRLKSSVGVVEHRPDSHQPALIEGKAQTVGR